MTQSLERRAQRFDRFDRVRERSTNATPAALKSGPKSGLRFNSALAIPVRSRRKSLSNSTSSRPL